VSVAFNLLGDEWDTELDRPAYRRRQVSVGSRVGGELLGGSLYELPPGEKTWPYHFHLGNEEWLIVVAGRPTVRAPDGEHELTPGDCVCFHEGERGAHQVENRTDEPARVLIVSTLQVPQISRYPDSDKLSARSSREEAQVFRRADAADYWDGES
jgi:uncharacterized cupin superfamily protein